MRRDSRLKYIDTNMICKYCHSKMKINRIDFMINGNQDNLYLCKNCYSSSKEEIRLSKRINVIFGVNTCVFCGDIIPEGRHVCPNCERGCN